MTVCEMRWLHNRDQSHLHLRASASMVLPGCCSKGSCMHLVEKAQKLGGSNCFLARQPLNQASKLNIESLGLGWTQAGARNLYLEPGLAHSARTLHTSSNSIYVIMVYRGAEVKFLDLIFSSKLNGRGGWVQLVKSSTQQWVANIWWSMYCE